MDRPVRELNLELGRPDAAEALRRLAAEVEAARKMGTPAMKLVHGYGSSGKGGRLRTACRTWLRQQELCFLPGEEFSIFNQEARPRAGPGGQAVAVASCIRLGSAASCGRGLSVRFAGPVPCLRG